MDRRYLYLVVLLVVIIPLIRPLGIPLSVSSTTMTFVNIVEKVDAGDKVLFAFDYSIGGEADVGPQAQVVMAHLMQKGAKVVSVAFIDTGIQFATKTVEAWERKGKVYGEDLLNLGYAAGAETAISAFGQDIRAVFPTDVRGKPLDQYSIMQGIRTAGDFKLIVEFSTGNPGPAEWVQQVQTRFKVPLACGVVAVMGPMEAPYLQSGQLVGLLGGGMTSAAEYEIATKIPGSATAAMDAQSLGHMVLVLFIILGNVAFFLKKKQDKVKKA
jgi:hypothetical protein